MEANNAAAGEGILRATVTITRKATGKVETYQLTSEPVPIEVAQQIATQQPKEEQ